MPQEGWGPGPEPSPEIPTATQLLPLSASFHITVSEPSLPQMQSTDSANKALSIPAGPCKHPPCPEPPSQPCPGARPRSRGAGEAGGRALPLPCPHHGEGQKESTSSADRKTGIVSIFCRRGSHIPIFLG